MAPISVLQAPHNRHLTGGTRVPTDHSLDSATATTRRSFLARTAVGGALVTAGAVAGPLTHLLPTAGAQEASTETLLDADFAAFAAPLELAAVQAYQAALSSEQLDATWTSGARTMQNNHQQVAATLTTLLDAEAPAPLPDAAFTKSATDAIAAAGDQLAVLKALATVEETLAATHLSAVPALREPTTAKLVSQVVAVEGQQAALLGVGGGGSVESVTPAEATTDGALSPSDAEATTTTTAAN